MNGPVCISVRLCLLCVCVLCASCACVCLWLTGVVDVRACALVCTLGPDVCVSVFLYVWLYGVCGCLCLCMYIGVYVCMYVCMYECLCMFVCIGRRGRFFRAVVAPERVDTSPHHFNTCHQADRKQQDFLQILFICMKFNLISHSNHENQVLGGTDYFNVNYSFRTDGHV